MPDGGASLIAPVAGATIGAIGSKGANKQQQTTQVDQYKDWPEIQEAIKKQILPRMDQQLNTPYPALPMTRAADPASDPFASRAMFDLQMAKDSGAWNPTPQPTAPTQAAPAAAPTATALDNLRAELSATQGGGGANKSGYFGGGTPYKGVGAMGAANDPNFVQKNVLGQGVKRFYSLSPEQQQQVVMAAYNNELADPAAFQSKYNFNPFSYG